MAIPGNFPPFYDCRPRRRRQFPFLAAAICKECVLSVPLHRAKIRLSERWLSGRKHGFAKAAYG